MRCITLRRRGMLHPSFSDGACNSESSLEQAFITIANCLVGSGSFDSLQNPQVSGKLDKNIQRR